MCQGWHPTLMMAAPQPTSWTEGDTAWGYGTHYRRQGKSILGHSRFTTGGLGEGKRGIKAGWGGGRNVWENGVKTRLMVIGFSGHPLSLSSSFCPTFLLTQFLTIFPYEGPACCVHVCWEVCMRVAGAGPWSSEPRNYGASSHAEWECAVFNN